MSLKTLIARLAIAGLLYSLGGMVFQATAQQPSAAPSTNEADKAWSELLRNSRPPEPPEIWRTSEPSESEVKQFEGKEADRLSKAADQARNFQTRFPKDPRADEARTKEYDLLSMAAQMGSTNVLTRLEALDEARLKDLKIPEEERFQVAFNTVNRRAMAKLPVSRAAAFEELEKGARALLKQFPNRTESYELLQFAAMESEPEKALKLAKEISESAAPEQVKAAVKPLFRIGKPVPIQFTAVDGRPVDLAKLKGKVVLIDFWATWCGPCLQEIPNVRSAYEKLNPKGFEIVGISFDREKAKLVNFVKEQRMPWPQYFDGKQWENEIGKRFEIQSIPTMWLVDKQGNVRDVNGSHELEAKVEKLLAETPGQIAKP